MQRESHDIFEMINTYLDEELDRREEPALFTLMADDPAAREYFKQLHILKNSTEITAEEFPDALDAKILSALSTPKKSSRNIAEKWLMVSVTGFALLFAVVAFFLFSELNTYKRALVELDSKIQTQNKTIEMLYNSFPVVTVKPVINN